MSESNTLYVVDTRAEGVDPGELVPMSSPGPLDKNPAAVYLGSLTPGGVRVQRQALEVIAGILGAPDYLAVPWAALRFQHTAAIRAHLTDRAPATANRILCALRQTLRAAWRLGQMSAEDCQRAADIHSITGSTLPAGRELTPGEIAGLLSSCEADNTPAGIRDAAVIALMYAAGLRRDEVVNLDVENYDPESGKLSVLVAKRNKQRTAYINGGAAQALGDWLAIRGDAPGALFYPVLKSGKIVPRRMANQAVYNLLAKRAELAGVADFSPHDLRRTFVSDLLAAGADISTVAKMAGHSSVNTTAKYDRRPEEAKQKAAGLLHVPYHGRK